MTQLETISAVKALGLSCLLLDGEFRVAIRGWLLEQTEPTAYYTRDREDALSAARLMARELVA